MNDRLKFIDIAKAIGIICVCIGHSGTSTFIVTAVMLFQMPLFYFIGGYLYKDYYSEHPFIRIKKSIKAYYLPFLAYDIGYLVLHNLFAWLHLVDGKNGGGAYSLKEFTEHFIDIITGCHREYFSGALWFLIAIFMITIGFSVGNYLLLKLRLERYKIHIILAVAICCFLFSKISAIPKPMIVRRASGGMFFFVIGYLYRYFGWEQILSKYKKTIFLSAAAVLGVIAWLNEMGYFSDVYNHIGASAAGGLLGIGLVLVIAGFGRFQNNKYLIRIGRSSLEIMALHFLAFKIVSFVIVIIYQLPVTRLSDYPVIEAGGVWWICYTLAGVIVPVILKSAVVQLKGNIRGKKT